MSTVFGLHRVTVREIAEHEVRVRPLEAIDATPVVDLRPGPERRRHALGEGSKL